MFSKISTVCFQGIEVASIEAQIQISTGLPAFSIVGLPDKAVTESRERVRAALNALGLSLPPKRIVVNLAPADIQKEGSHYDLPIALGVLIGLDVLPNEELNDYIALGELALDARLTYVTGTLSVALHAASIGKGLICPRDCGNEAIWGGDLKVLAPTHLLEIINHFKGTQVLLPPQAHCQDEPAHPKDLKDVKGQKTAKRALEVAAAGGHNLLMIGPPGSGKSMMAARLPGILPPLEPKEALEVTMIHSLAGRLENGKLLRQRPFRDPHHSASMVSIIGGGLRAYPGEVSLAHQGVLFLDEFPEFHKGALEALRQPLESGKAVIARANAHITYPARFQLVAAMNPCKCGYLSDVDRACRRAPLCGQDYQGKLSGPLLDRIDLSIEVPPIPVHELQNIPQEEASSPPVQSRDVAARIAQARRIQKERLQSLGVNADIHANAQIDGDLLSEIATPESEAALFLKNAAEKLKLSARSYHRTLRISRTLADLAHCDVIQKIHIAEALSYRVTFPRN